MKIFLLIVVFLVFVFFAICVYLRYYYRFTVFKDMVYICKYLKNNITFNKTTIDELLHSVGKKISFVTKSLINGFGNKKSNYLSNEDCLDVDRFIGSLGKGDVSFEINNISYYEKEFEEKKKLYKESLNKEGKMYLKLIIVIGIAICIILI